MKFNFFLKNHHTTGVGSLEDIVRPIAAGMIEGGHRVQFEYHHLLPRPWVNIMFEYFPDPRLIEELEAAKRRDILLGMICTEDPADTISMGEAEERRRYDNLLRALPSFDFVWSIVPVEGYEKIMGADARPRFLEFGHCPSLTQAPPEDKTIDVLLYGKLNKYRAPVVHELLKRGIHVESTFGDLPEYIRYNMIARSKLVLDMRRGEVVRYLSPSRIVAALHAGALVAAEYFDRTELSRFYDFTETAPRDELVECCAALIGGGRCRELAIERQAKFARETSMRANIEKLLAELPA